MRVVGGARKHRDTHYGMLRLYYNSNYIWPLKLHSERLLRECSVMLHSDSAVKSNMLLAIPIIPSNEVKHTLQIDINNTLIGLPFSYYQTASTDSRDNREIIGTGKRTPKLRTHCSLIRRKSISVMNSSLFTLSTGPYYHICRFFR